MLPDVPTLKQEIAKALHAVFRQRVNAYMGAINELPRCYIKEGQRVAIRRADGTVDETILKQASAEMSVRYEDVPQLSVEKRIVEIDRAAREMANQISGHAFRQISEAVEKVGNVIDSGKKPLGPDALFAVLEKIQMDFKADGTPEELTVVIPPQMRQQAVDCIDAMNSAPDLKQRYDAIVDKKRMEWRDREASRKLVG